MAPLTPHLLQTEPPAAAEQQTVMRLSAPRATLRLRFPIADLRPERDPWAGRAVRAEQLRLELSEPQFRSELSSGPGPPAPTRLELTCSDLHGESPRGMTPGAGGLGLQKGLGHSGADPGQGLTSSVGYQYCLAASRVDLYPWAAAHHGHEGGHRSVNSKGQSLRWGSTPPLTPPGIGEEIIMRDSSDNPPPRPSSPGTYEDGEKPPVPCLRVSRALDPKSPGRKYFLPQ